ncbi:PcfJ domain-containing protein [uncultured Psychromonas sp.]|uniref:PcfJ domain-containing protein n=1 Tax=uncultured Psychromonas sp. TaxID=173974 RepID=UPI002635CBC1|nr:PcfJ domain-containing protein [uncultured Psychromonas sp.]
MKIDFEKIVSIDLKGNLLFSIAPDFNRRFMITSWNSGMRFYVYTEDGWLEEETDTGLMLVCDENIDLYNEPISLFLKQLPQELIELVKPYRYRQFSLLQLISQQPQLFDIFKHSSNLFWMLVVEAENRHWNKLTIGSILQQKREFIIEKLINIKCKKRVRFIQKLVFYKHIHCEFRMIKKALKADEIVTAFDHWKSIPIQAILVVIDFPYFLKTLILENEVNSAKSLMSHQIRFRKYKGIVDDIGLIADTMGNNLTDRYKAHIYDARALKRLHVNWITRFNHSNEFIQFLLSQVDENEMIQNEFNIQSLSSSDRNFPVEKLSFPLCPLGNATFIMQIKNNFELLLEGLTMKHCVGSCAQHALKGQSYYYKIISPQRATLELTYNQGKFNIKQFKLAHNQTPSALSYQAIHAWMTN